MNYLSHAQLLGALSMVDIRIPGMSVELFRHPIEGFQNCCLAITFTVVDAYNTDERQTQRVNVPIPPLVSHEHFIDWLHWRLSTIAVHEVSEMLWYDRYPAYDPHSPDYWDLRLDAYT